MATPKAGCVTYKNRPDMSQQGNAGRPATVENTQYTYQNWNTTAAVYRIIAVVHALDGVYRQWVIAGGRDSI